MWVIVCLAIGMAVVRGAPGPSGAVWRFLLIMLGLFIAQWIWFIVVPRQSLRLARGNPERQRRLLRLVINTPFPSGPKVFARFLLAASDQVGKHYAQAEPQFRAILGEIEGGRNVGFESLVRQHLADTLDALGRRQEAEAQRARAHVSVRDTKKSYVTLHAQAKLLDREHRYAEAYELHEQALLLVPPKPKELRLELMMHLVLSAYNAGRPADSLRWAESIIETDPEWKLIDSARRMAAIACSNLGRLGDAERHVRVAVDHAKAPEKRAESMALLAEYVMRRGNLVEAEKIAREAEALNPGKKRVPWAVIGSVKKEQGQFEEAIAAYERMNTIAEGHIPAYSRRASAAVSKELAPVYAEVGRLDDALELIHQAERELAEDPKLGVTLDAAAALVHAKCHERDQASARMASSLERLKVIPESLATRKGALYILGRAALENDEPERAEEFLRAYLDLNPDPLYRPYAYYHLAECRRRLGDKAGGRALDVQAASTRFGTLYEQLARERLARDLLEPEGTRI
jgi:tetratricopeptide (TPR) repeat protein